MGNENFNAVISDRTGIGLLMNGPDVYAVNLADETPTRVSAQDFAFLFGVARDFEFFEDVSAEQARHSLRIANRREQAIDLVLIILDESYPNDIRTEAAEDLADFLREKEIVQHLDSVMFSAPLPENTNLAAALAVVLPMSEVHDWLRRLGEMQPTIGFQKFPTFRGKSIAEFAAWLATPLEHKKRDLYDSIFAEKRNPANEKPPEAGMGRPDPALSPGSRAAQSELEKLLKEAIRELPIDERMIVIWHFYEEMPFTEIAKLLSSTDKAAKKRITDALRHLKERLGGSK